MKILFASSEVVPFAKTGGLADVSGALPLVLEDLGIEIAVVMPGYKEAKKLKIKNLNKNLSCSNIGKNIKVYFIENDKFFNRDGLYADSQGEYDDNLERFLYFCRRTLDSIKEINFKPDIIHCNDWHSALIPIYLRKVYSKDNFFKDIKTILTIHNLAYQGIFSKKKFPKLNLPLSLLNIDGLGFDSKINLLKGGLIFSDLITTVSETYAKEIQTPEFGCGLDRVLKNRKKDIFGILNGVDYKIWNPNTDSFIFKRFSKDTILDKYENKTRLQKICNLRSDPKLGLIGMVGRLAEQKGIDILVASIHKMKNLGLQLIILGSGDIRYHNILKNLGRKYKDFISINLKFDDVLAHRIYAGCDMFLLPSRYEPCGLGQLISFKYGTIPIVKKTGGLADTVKDFDLEKNSGNGFVFDSYNKNALLDAVNKAMLVYKNKEVWLSLMKKVIDYDFSWEESAKKYIKLYRRLSND